MFNALSERTNEYKNPLFVPIKYGHRAERTFPRLANFHCFNANSIDTSSAE